MRTVSAICVLLALVASVTAAERAWRNGTWAPGASSGAYVIETRTDVITGESGSGETLTATSGTAVQFAIEGQTLYVRDGNSEHRV